MSWIQLFKLKNQSNTFHQTHPIINSVCNYGLGLFLKKQTKQNKSVPANKMFLKVEY